MRLANVTICHTTLDSALLLPHCSSFYIRLKTRRRKKRRKEGRKKENGGIVLSMQDQQVFACLNGNKMHTVIVL